MFKSTPLCLAVVLCLTISELEAIPTAAVINTVVKATFDKVDSNNDDNVDKEEFATFVNNADVNDDDCIDKDEYVVMSEESEAQAVQTFQIFSKSNGCIIPASLKSMFDVMDTNKNGFVTLDEMKYFYKELFDIELQLTGNQ